MENITVAVIGAGPAGLAVLKNLKEEGFKVTGFEKRDSAGGVWAYSEDPLTTSTLPETVSNVSKYGNSFTDFPIPDHLPSHLTSAQTCEYIKSYASHFDLNRHIQFSTSVNWIKRNADDTKWQVCTSRARKEVTNDFDKVAICSGLSTKAIIPKFGGEEKFKGEILHVQRYKRPSDFKGKRVLVVGIGNSGCDTTTQLIGHAKDIYLSHRGGVKILPRIVDGAPLDLVVTRQKNVIKFVLDRYLTSVARFLFDWTIERYSKQAFKLDPAWRLSPAPSLANHQPVICDGLVDSLWAKEATSVHGLKRFISEDKVELLDGTTLEIDTVILCTGYQPDFSITPDFNPLDSEKGNTAGINATPLARLYQNIFPPKYADSLAIINYIALADGAITISDLVGMALPQIWNGNSPLPSLSTMNASIDKHHEWVRALGRDDSVYTGIVRPGPWFAFLNSAAGTRVDEMLGYGWEGWKFWVRERRLCGLLMRGVMTPFMYRVFEGGKRKVWRGAREAVVHANEEVVRVYGK
ncbi:hypothetical protein ONS95_000009 [Cadophora gregata]|uniref:uncharacterized protein n=1 Tax=Cadophora gregata TaxID=51156 RepID=UPI0026DC0147|nr:uncharacterized protein ONS95_000009 [Cadophora gregata]KAK0128020.1 hypothetical protein ONS95_000009 [Cadophora gregata]